jgi:hypothetical protein
LQWQATALVAPQGNHDFHCGAKHLTLWPSFRQDIAEGTMMGGANTSVASDVLSADRHSLTNVQLVVTLEESGLHGGVGSAVAARMREARIDTPVRSVGVPQRFLTHASRSEIHADLGLTAADLATNIGFWVQRPADVDVNRGE